MPASIGVNLRVTGHCRQGGRKYMEDFFSVAYQQTEDERDLEYAFIGIYDGHGGAEAAEFAKERLMETIVRHRNFWSDNDEDVLRAIKMGYLATHYAMWKEQENWPRTASGLPSTAGTTASIAFIRRGKIYVGHVGDSAIVLGYQEPGSYEWKAKPLTRDHKPECANEMSRIQSCGGKVVAKSGVARVVWNRPRIGHKGPVRRSTPIDEIPFLAVARSLGDLWSYNSELDAFVVSPSPDCSVVPIDTSRFRCLIFGTDGLFNMLSPQRAVAIVQQAERHNEESALSGIEKMSWVNPSKCLVEKALEMWSNTKVRADNTSVVTLMLDPPGPPKAEVLRNRRKAVPDNGLKIVTRYTECGNEGGGDVIANDGKADFVDSSCESLTDLSECGSSNVDKNCENMEYQNINLDGPHESPRREPLRESLSFNPSERVSPPSGRVQHKIRSAREMQEEQQGDGNENDKNDKTSEFFVSNLERRRRLETLVPYGFFLRTVPDLIPTSPEISNLTGDSKTSLTSKNPPLTKDSPLIKPPITPSPITPSKPPSPTENIQINEVSSSSSEISEESDLKAEVNSSPRPKMRPRRNRKRKRIDDEDEKEKEQPQAKRPHVVPPIPDSPPKRNLRIRKMSVLESVHRRSEEIVNMMDTRMKRALVDVNVEVKRKGVRGMKTRSKKNSSMNNTSIKNSSLKNSSLNSSVKSPINQSITRRNVKNSKKQETLVKKMNKENRRRNVPCKVTINKEKNKKKAKSRTLRVEHLRKLRNHVLLRSQRKS